MPGLKQLRKPTLPGIVWRESCSWHRGSMFNLGRAFACYRASQHVHTKSKWMHNTMRRENPPCKHRQGWHDRKNTSTPDHCMKKAQEAVQSSPLALQELLFDLDNPSQGLGVEGKTNPSHTITVWVTQRIVWHYRPWRFHTISSHRNTYIGQSTSLRGVHWHHDVFFQSSQSKTLTWIIQVKIDLCTWILWHSCHFLPPMTSPSITS